MQLTGLCKVFTQQILNNADMAKFMNLFAYII